MTVTGEVQMTAKADDRPSANNGLTSKAALAATMYRRTAWARVLPVATHDSLCDGFALFIVCASTSFGRAPLDIARQFYCAVHHAGRETKVVGGIGHVSGGAAPILVTYL